MEYKYLLICTGIIALVSYLPSIFPMALFRKKISNRYIRSFLIYMPYGILSAMIFPAVFYSTGHVASAICGTLLALFLAYHRKGLLTVSIAAVAAVFLSEQLLNWVL